MELKKEATNMETAITALIVLLVFYAGYFTGKGVADAIVDEQAKKFRKKMTVGAVDKPTAAARAMEGTRQEETEEAMTETLDELGIKPNEDIQKET